MYEDGKQIASNVPAGGPKVWDLKVPVKEGSRYILAQQADLGDPYGGYRGQPGLRCPSPCYHTPPWRGHHFRVTLRRLKRDKGHMGDCIGEISPFGMLTSS